MLVLFLDLSVEAAAQRGNFGQERYEREDLQREVRLPDGAPEAIPKTVSSREPGNSAR